MALVTGSGSPEDGRNPSFTLIEFDEEYMVPLNAHVYYMNLSEANADLSVAPVWKEQYDLISEYNLTDLSPSTMREFALNMQRDPKLASRFEWNKDRRAFPYEERPYPDQCLLASEEFEWKDCKHRPVHIDLLNPPSVNDIGDFLIGRWIKVEGGRVQG